MSKESGEERRVVTVEELIARATQLREYLNLLNSQIESLTLQASELQLVINTLNSLPETSSSNLMVLDRFNTVFIPININENWLNHVIVNIGGSYYIKTNRDKAVELINKRLDSVKRVLDELVKRYQIVLNEYNAIQRVLSAVYAKIMEEKKETSVDTSTAG
ncbi:MAG: prefoldin subunit alpha [Desulfurococcaceae archaeon]|uniref:Prefoldin subunit alpha n=2 Tax=Staphylothermus marinus TaxID=2280 RepID=A0A7C4H8R6_STAMA